MQQALKLEQISRERLVQELDPLALNGISPLQHPELAHLLHPGIKHLYFGFREHNNLKAFAVVMLRRGVFADLYFGPVSLDNPAHELPFLRLLKNALRRRGAMILRVFPPLNFPLAGGLPARLNWATMIVDISRPAEDVLQSFSPNHRQSIAKAIRAGIVATDLGFENAPSYAKGYLEMFARRGFQKDLAQETMRINGLLQHPQQAFALGAWLDRNLIGGGVFLLSGDTCFYYQGFAGRLDPPQPVLHLLLWRAMQKAQVLGCKYFDLYGYSRDENDTQLSAINDFKKWFRGELVVYPDTVLIPLWQPISWLLRLSGKRF